MGDIRTGRTGETGTGDHLEMWVAGTLERVRLLTDRVSVGQSASNDVSVPFDRTASRVHAVFERIAGRWCVRDLSSRNGTFVNGQRIWGERPLDPGDEIRIGEVRFVARLATQDRPEDVTIGAETGPPLTPREREVLLALCGPMFSGDVFREPATIRQIAAELVVTEAAVKQHLSRLYDKFSIHESEGRRTRLANEAIRRGAVSAAEILGRTRRTP